MRKRILIGIAAFFYYSGLVSLARWWTRRAGQRLVILNYHRASGGTMHQQWLYLKRHYRIMHAEEALEELYGSPSGKRQPTPLVLSFDDGYQDNYTHAFALARALHVPFTIYLIPGYIESGKHFWWGERKRLVRRAQVQEVIIEGHKYRLNDPQERRALVRAIDSQARYATSVDERERFLALACDALAVSSTPAEEELAAMSVTWEQVHAMAESGYVSFGAHTMHHPILSYLTDPAEIEREVTICRVVLEQQLGHPVRSFAYPVGQAQHIGTSVLEAVRQAGYRWALTTSYGINTPASNPLLLQRIEVDVDQHWLVVAAETAGLWGFFSRLRWLPFVRKYLTNSAK